MVESLRDAESSLKREKVARDNLERLSAMAPPALGVRFTLVVELSNVLCLQERFDEATAMLDEGRRRLAASSGSEEALARVDVLRGAVLARSGQARKALPILEAVATNRFSGAGYY